MSHNTPLDPAINRMHRCVAIMLNLSQRPSSKHSNAIYTLCQETMDKTSTTAPGTKNIAKMYLEPRTPQELTLPKYSKLHKTQYTAEFLNRINDDVVMPLLRHEPISNGISFEQYFANLVILEENDM